MKEYTIEQAIKKLLPVSNPKSEKQVERLVTIEGNTAIANGWGACVAVELSRELENYPGSGFSIDPVKVSKFGKINGIEVSKATGIKIRGESSLLKLPHQYVTSGHIYRKDIGVEADISNLVDSLRRAIACTSSDLATYSINLIAFVGKNIGSATGVKAFWGNGGEFLDGLILNAEQAKLICRVFAGHVSGVVYRGDDLLTIESEGVTLTVKQSAGKLAPVEKIVAKTPLQDESYIELTASSLKGKVVRVCGCVGCETIDFFFDGNGVYIEGETPSGKHRELLVELPYLPSEVDCRINAKYLLDYLNVCVKDETLKLYLGLAEKKPIVLQSDWGLFFLQKIRKWVGDE